MLRPRRPWLVAGVAIVLAACSATPAATPSPAPSTPATAAPSATATPPATASPAATTAPTAVPTVAVTPGATASAAASSSATATASASTAPSSSSGATGQTLTVHAYQGFTSFYPFSTTAIGGDALAMELQWDFMAAYDDHGNPQMRLADSITASPDAKTWTIKLKPDLKWSDGTPLTSADVLFTIGLEANPGYYNNQYWLGIMGAKAWQAANDLSKPIPGLTAPDATTVVFQLDGPNAAFLSTLLNVSNYILPSAQILAAAPNLYSLSWKDLEALPYWQAPTVGEGPYLWDKTETGQFLSFHKNPLWRGKPLVFDQVILKPIPDYAVSAAQAQAGEVDLAVVALGDLDGLSAAGLQTATAVAPFAIQSDFNNSVGSQFHDARVRQAFMFGCDRQGFVDSFLKGKGLAPDSYFFPEWVPKDGVKSYAYNLDTAKQLLDAAKFDYSKPITWLSWNKDARDRQSFLEACQASMKSIGVDVEIVNGLEATDKLFKAGTWDLLLYGGYPILDPDILRTVLGCDGIGKDKKANGYVWGGVNYTNYCNPTFDQQMLAASKTPDQSQRAALYKQAQDIFLDDVPVMINYRNATAYAWSSKLQGVVPYGDPSQLFLTIDGWSKSS